MHSCNTTPTFRTTLQQFGRQRHWMGLAQRRLLQAISSWAGKCRSGATSSPNTPLSAQYNNFGSTTLARLAVRCPDSVQRFFYMRSNGVKCTSGREVKQYTTGTKILYIRPLWKGDCDSTLRRSTSNNDRIVALLKPKLHTTYDETIAFRFHEVLRAVYLAGLLVLEMGQLQ